MLPGTTFALFPRSTFRAIHGLPLKRWTPVMPAISPPIPTGAREYLLTDSCDTSVYRSAQEYTDNVMNIAMPSAYRFVRKVLGELRRMYEKAGVELSVVHIGGDEVPRGAWSGSPICREFMDRNGLADTHALKDHFVRWLYGELDAKGTDWLAGRRSSCSLTDDM